MKIYCMRDGCYGHAYVYNDLVSDRLLNELSGDQIRSLLADRGKPVYCSDECRVAAQL